MGLFTSLTFNNGAAHVFTERGQIPDLKYIIREYIELAAAQAAASKIRVKHDLAKTTVRRALLQRTVNLACSDGVLRPYTGNFTSTFHPLHLVADIVLEQKLLAAAIADVTFHTNFVNGLS